METATLVAIFISGLLVSFTGYALYTAFGQPSQQLRDPFSNCPGGNDSILYLNRWLTFSK
ncbi:putative photosystem II PsbN [Helianthus annuus]|uniref:Photosystem II PsbN n=1 Tax=Helianthus annuus TaxID=4232 RepID=A0A9K3NNB7_HELAN|nr:putative photosystem II PsbN [Helianthus annuus]KAJ0569912.1 putative photosystem II PsbN [Helianthus annuus]KAJ0576581.1 putative photosystem II PsbN [Helianthus annuus]KAJ0576584.1 putative photosystem II PsbN [Helianthus annuus]KAJ0584242.1 putative photosystem II PsbN [Helianthus annuus]